jgi:hypothetical protein
LSNHIRRKNPLNVFNMGIPKLRLNLGIRNGMVRS